MEVLCVCGLVFYSQAIDDDAEEPNNVIEYSIMKTEPANIFDINADTGEIMLKPYIKSMDIVQNITNQKETTWSVVIQAKDRGNPSFTTTTVVKIDIAEEVSIIPLHVVNLTDIVNRFTSGSFTNYFFYIL